MKVDNGVRSKIMERKTLLAYAKTSKERLEKRTDEWLAHPEVKATLRRNHETMQAMKTPQISKKA